MLKKPVILDQNSRGKTLVPIEENQSVYNELWLQNTIDNNPEILPVSEIESVFYPLVSIGREVHTDTGGFIDNLFISPGGYITFAETKLWRNSQARREVLSQVLEYASSIKKWEYQDIDTHFQSNQSRKNIKVTGLAEWMHLHYQVDRIDFEKNVTRFLKMGRFLILIVGDRIREELINYFDDLNLPYNIAFVELQCFTMSESETWPLFVVPFVPKQTEVIQHHVRMESQSPETYYETHRQNRTLNRRNRVDSIRMSEKEYWEQLKVNHEPSVSLTKTLIEYIQTVPGVTVDLEKSSIVARYKPLNMTVFYIYTDGLLTTRPFRIKKTLLDKGLGEKVIGDYEELIRVRLGLRGNEECKVRITEVNLEEFKNGVTALLNRIHSHTK